MLLSGSGGVIVSEHIAKFQRGVRVVKVNKSIDEGIESVQERLKKKNGMYGLLVDETAVNTIKEFRTYAKKVIGTSAADDYTMDCIRYVVHTDSPVASSKFIFSEGDGEQSTSPLRTHNSENRKRERIKDSVHFCTLVGKTCGVCFDSV